VPDRNGEVGSHAGLPVPASSACPLTVNALRREGVP
jgi:hypothetical protein